MSVQFSADVHALFEDLGIEVEKVRAVKSGLVIDRFDRAVEDGLARAKSSTCWAYPEYDVELAA